MPRTKKVEEVLEQVVESGILTPNYCMHQNQEEHSATTTKCKDCGSLINK